MAISQSVIDEIAEKIDIVDVIGDYVALHKRGNNYVGLSPFSNEKTPSFNVNPSKGFYYCFSTGQGGSIFTFIMKMESLSFPEAVKLLGRKIGIEVDMGGQQTDATMKHHKVLQELYNRITKSFHHMLVQSEEGRSAYDYLHERSVELATITKYGIGYAPPDPYWLFKFLQQKGYSPQFLSHCGLFKRGNASLFTNRIIFPIRNFRGDTVAFGGRYIESVGPKYLNSPTTSLFQKGRILYGLWEARSAIQADKSCYLVEGYMDVLALSQAQCHNVVASMGTALTDDQIHLMHRYAENCTIIFDSDEAGVRATFKAAMMLEQGGVFPEVTRLPIGTDPAEILKNYGAEYLKSSIKNSKLSIMDYCVKLLPHNTNSDRRMREKYILQNIFPYINSISTEIRRDEALKVLSDTLQMELHAMQSDYRNWKDKVRNPRISVREQISAKQPDTILHRPELSLMLAAIEQKEKFELVRKMLPIEQCTDDDAQRIYIIAEECYRRGTFTLNALLTQIKDTRLCNIAAYVLDQKLFTDFTLDDIRSMIDRLRIQLLKTQERKYIQRLRLLKKEEYNIKKENELQQEIMYLNTEIQKIKGGKSNATGK